MSEDNAYMIHTDFGLVPGKDSGSGHASEAERKAYENYVSRKVSVFWAHGGDLTRFRDFDSFPDWRRGNQIEEA